MALPTNGRVIIDTTAGEIDVELWSKVCPIRYCGLIELPRSCPSGNTKNMSEFHSFGNGRYAHNMTDVLVRHALYNACAACN